MHILYCLEKMQMITPFHLKILVYTNASMSSVYKALKNLENSKLIGFHNYGTGQGVGNHDRLYFLTKKGFELVNGTCGEVYKKNYKEPLTISNYNHRHKILDFWIVLQMESKKHNETYQLLFFAPEWQKINGNTIVIKTNDGSIRPDASFIIKNLKTDREALFFVEIDTGTETVQSKEYPCVQGKFDKYQEAFRCGDFRMAYEDFGYFEGARMLFITNSEKRVINLLQNIEIDPMFKDAFLFSIHHEMWWHGVLYGRFAKQGCNQAVRMNSKPFNDISQ